MLGHDVSVRPDTAAASTSSHGPWQIAATGFSDSMNSRTNWTAAGTIRSASGFATPPGRSSASYSLARTSESGRSTGSMSPFSS